MNTGSKIGIAAGEGLTTNHTGGRCSVCLGQHTSTFYRYTAVPASLWRLVAIFHVWQGKAIYRTLRTPNKSQAIVPESKISTQTARVRTCRTAQKKAGPAKRDNHTQRQTRLPNIVSATTTHGQSSLLPALPDRYQKSPVIDAMEPSDVTRTED